jgi:DNA-binding MarR family transcriptional regulator
MGEALVDAIVATTASLQWRVRGLDRRGALTRGRLAVLRQLARAGSPMRVSALGRALGCTMSNITQIVGRLLAQGFVDVITYERRPAWRAILINTEGRVAIGRAEAEAALRAEAEFAALATEDRATLDALLERLRSPPRSADPGEPHVLASGLAVRAARPTPDEAEVAKRTPPDPEEEAQRRREELIARARSQDPKKLSPPDLKIWDFESRGIPAPDEYYEDAKMFREFAESEARGPP